MQGKKERKEEYSKREGYGRNDRERERQYLSQRYKKGLMERKRGEMHI